MRYTSLGSLKGIRSIKFYNRDKSCLFNIKILMVKLKAPEYDNDTIHCQDAYHSSHATIQSCHSLLTPWQAYIKSCLFGPNRNFSELVILMCACFYFISRLSPSYRHHFLMLVLLVSASCARRLSLERDLVVRQAEVLPYWEQQRVEEWGVMTIKSRIL